MHVCVTVGAFYSCVCFGVCGDQPVSFLPLAAFKTIEGQQAAFQKLVYIVGNLACLAMAVYKCQVMGLLPTHASDWLAFAQPQQVSTPPIGSALLNPSK